MKSHIAPDVPYALYIWPYITGIKSTGGAFDPPTQQTIKHIIGNHVPSIHNKNASRTSPLVHVPFLSIATSPIHTLATDRRAPCTILYSTSHIGCHKTHNTVYTCTALSCVSTCYIWYIHVALTYCCTNLKFHCKGTVTIRFAL